MKLIVEGSPQDINFVERICRDMVRRGRLKLSPAADAVDEPDGDDVEEDSKYVTPSDSKNPKRAGRSKKSE